MELFDTIHSVDSIKLATILNQQAKRCIPILLEINISGESTKHGLQPEGLPDIIEAIGRLPSLNLQGLMTIAPQTEDPEQVRPVFRRLRELRDSFQLDHLSMGMTDDFEVAIEEGATMVRVGRAIFGEKDRVNY